MTQGGHNKRGQSKSRRIKMWHNMIKFYLNTMPLQQHELQRQRVNNTVSLAGLLCCFASQFNCSCCAAFSVLLQQLFSRLLFSTLVWQEPDRSETEKRPTSTSVAYLSFWTVHCSMASATLRVLCMGHMGHMVCMRARGAWNAWAA